MAVTLNRILNDSQQAAQVYAALVDASNVDEKAWEFVQMQKDHEQIAGDIQRIMRESGQEIVDKPRATIGDIKKSPHRRLYEDLQVLQALIEAEKAQIADCESLMSRGERDRLVHTFVSNQVLPVLRSHVDNLKAYLKRASKMSH